MNKILIAIMMVAFPFLIVQASAFTTPTGVVNYVNISLNNQQSSAVSAGTPVMITFNGLNYTSYFNGNTINFEAFNGLTGNVLYSWFEGNELNEVQVAGFNGVSNDILWVILPTQISASTNAVNVISIGFLSMSSTALNGNKVGMAPQLYCAGGCPQSNYGEYDNGANVFSYYQNWGGLSSLPSGWSDYINQSTISFSASNTKLAGIQAQINWEGVYISNPTSFSTYPNVFDTLMSDTYSSTSQLATGWCSTTLSSGSNCGNPDSTKVIGDGMGSCASNYYCFSSQGSQTSTTQTLPNSAQPYVYSIEQQSSSTANVIYQYNKLLTKTGLSGAESYLFTAVANLQTVYLWWMRGRIDPPNGIMPTVTSGTVQNTPQSSLTINPNPAIYGQMPSITATWTPSSDVGEIIINGGIYTSNIVATGTGSASYTMPILAVGTYTVNSFDTNALTSIVQTLTINRGNTILTFNQQCSQLTLWTSSGCTTTSNIISINNQVTGNVFVNANGLVANTFLLDSTTNQVSDNSIAVGNYTFTFNTLQTANYSANSISYQFYLYVPVTSQNSLGATSLTPNTETIGSTQLQNYYPLKLYTTSPSNTLAYSLRQSKDGGASTQLQTTVSNLGYIPPPTQATGNYAYKIQENESSPYGQLSFTYNSLTNMTDITNTFTFNNPVIQYDANLANFSKGSFTASPKSWQIWSSPLTTTKANTILGDQFQSGSLTIPVNVQLMYSFTTFNISLPNNPAVQTTITQNAMQFIATNSATSNIIKRKILNVSTYSEGNFSRIPANTTVSFTALFNNYTIAGSVNFNANQFYVYMPLSNYQNPSIFVSNMVTISKASNFFQAINNFCPSTIANGSVQQYKPYLVDAGGQLYTFQVYQGSGFTPTGYYMLVQESNGASSPQVQSYQIESVPFGLPLEVGIQYKFLFENPSCTSVVYQTPLSVWVSPISITLPQNNTIPAVQTINANATCSESFNAIAGVNSVTCTGVDPHNFVTSWTIKLFNVTSILNNSALLNETNISGSSFTWTHTLPANNIIYHVQVIGNDAGGANRYSQIILSWLSNLVTAPINPFAVTGAVIAVFAFFTLIFLGGTNKSMLIIFGVMILFILSTFNIIPMSAPAFFGILFVALILLFIFETDRL